MNRRTILITGLALATVSLLAACSHKPAAGSSQAQKPAGNQTAQSAITDAQGCISRAQQAGVDVSTAQQQLTQAKQAAQSGNSQKAQSTATQICSQLNVAMNDRQLQNARQLSQEAGLYTNLSSDEQTQLKQGQNQVASNQGQQAFQTLSALVQKLKTAKTTYTVEKGDNLWDISRKQSIYSEALEWPLIYANNSSSINDPDLIYPDQQLDIWLNPLKTEAETAMQYAQTRGPWQNGQALERDHAWLDKVKATISDGNAAD